MKGVLLQRIDRAALLLQSTKTLSEIPRPFLRWAGSKRRLLTQIVPHLPDEYSRYYEPFLGAGSLFFLLQPKNALLSDLNSDLMNVWRCIRESPSEVHERATARELNRENYYRTRDENPSDAFQKAGDFIFLNRGAFNGLYRVNRRGKFNVPWGAPRTGNVIELRTLQAASSVLSGRIALDTLPFDRAVARARKGDLVYLDPPYVTGHNNNGFVDYNEKIFAWKDQVRLSDIAERARIRGSTVLVSNAFHDEVIKLYPNFEVHELTRQSNIAGDKAKRGTTSEVLLVGR